MTIETTDYNTKVVQKTFTQAANVGAVNAFTIAGNVLIEAVIIRMTTYHANMTSLVVTAGAGDVVDLIDVAEGAAANLNAADKQVAWEGAVELGAGKVIKTTGAGAGAGSITFTMTVRYRQCTTDGYVG